MQPRVPGNIRSLRFVMQSLRGQLFTTADLNRALVCTCQEFAVMSIRLK